MLVDRLSQLAACPQRAVIVNVNTKLVSTLALLSALRYARMPVLLIDCESTDGSIDHFTILRRRYNFDLMNAPLRPHGDTLDFIFKEIQSDQVLLVDSDLEIHNQKIIDFCNEYIDEPTVFGSGFTNGPGWLRGPVFASQGMEGALFCERPWIPLTLLKTQPVREALECGKSFAAFLLNNEYSLLPWVVGSFLRRVMRRGPIQLRRHHHGVRPASVYYDTGAQVFQFLRYEKQLFFASLPEPVHRRYVTHFWGVTRHLLNPEDSVGAANFPKVEDLVRHRLESAYHEVF
jgi:hypothetical protein